MAQGGRSPTKATGALRVNKGRWSIGRKRDIVLRILRGETLDALDRELTVSPAKLAQWRDDFIQDLKTKISDQIMTIELLEKKISQLEDGLGFPQRRLSR